MGFFVLNSIITINSSVDGVGVLSFSGVHEVVVRKSIHSIVQTATVILPSKGYYKTKNGSVVTATTGQLFNDRDPITIQLGYNGQMETEFEGFVKRREFDMPLVVECEGYVQELRLDVSISANYNTKATSAKELLLDACEGTDINVLCPVDFPISGIRLIKADGVRICDYIKEASDHTLTLFFIEPDVLWCGLVYTAYATGAVPTATVDGVSGNGNVFNLPTVNYRIGYNTPRNNQLKQRIPTDPVQIIMKGKLASAVEVYTESKLKNAKRKLQSLVNHVNDSATVGRFAQEKEYQMNYTGYEGKLVAFLQPYAQPGYNAYITNSLYPDLNGTYVIESTEVKFGVNGARRICEIGPRLGFDNQ